MYNKFLLTYAIDGDVTYEWFQSEDELNVFIEKIRQEYGDKLDIFEAIEIIQRRSIKVEV